jgi:RimJ/RimL family protein N-acetyltransferase
VGKQCVRVSLSYLERRPATVLAAGTVELTMPCADDVPVLAAYGADSNQLEGIWVSGSFPDGDPHAWAQRRIDEFLAGWRAPGGPHGATLAIRTSGKLIGFVYMTPRRDSTVEISYGVVPAERCRGLATAAARLASTWALTEGGFRRAHLHVALGHTAGHRVAEKAGFREVGRVERHIEATAADFIQVVYERTLTS